MECWLKIQSEISIPFGSNAAFWNTIRCSRGITKFNVTIHDHCIHHIDNERIIDVLYWDYDYTVSNFNEQCQIVHQWFNEWGLSEQDYEIGEPERESDNRYSYSAGIIRVKVFACPLPFS